MVQEKDQSSFKDKMRMSPAKAEAEAVVEEEVANNKNNIDNDEAAHHEAVVHHRRQEALREQLGGRMKGKTPNPNPGPRAHGLHPEKF